MSYAIFEAAESQEGLRIRLPLVSFGPRRARDRRMTAGASSCLTDPATVAVQPPTGAGVRLRNKWAILWGNCGWPIIFLIFAGIFCQPV
jgi:hypothetical protein